MSHRSKMQWFFHDFFMFTNFKKFAWNSMIFPWSWNKSELQWFFKSCGNPVIALRWRHNGRGGVSNHQPQDCLLNRSFRRRSKKTSKLRFTGLCVGNSPGTSEFPAQMASNEENVSIWWCHHGSWSSLVQAMACCNINTEPSPKPMMTYHQSPEE